MLAPIIDGSGYACDLTRVVHGNSLTPLTCAEGAEVRYCRVIDAVLDGMTPAVVGRSHADDLTVVVDCACGSRCASECVAHRREVGHCTWAVGDECVKRSIVSSVDAGVPDDLILVVDPSGVAVGAAQRAEISHLGPVIEERTIKMIDGVPACGGVSAVIAHDLTGIVDRGSVTIEAK